MPIVTINNTTLELDYYGYLAGARIDTELATSAGIVDCILRRKLYDNELVIEADLWRTDREKALAITLFRASVLMRPDGQRYRVTGALSNACDYWRELERLISDLIVVNE